MSETTTQQKPADAMKAFIGELVNAGMGEAAHNALNQPKPPEAANETTATVPGAKSDDGNTPTVPPVVTPVVPKAGTDGSPVVRATPPDVQNDEPQDEKWPRKASDWDNYKKKRKEVEAQLKQERDTIKAERDKYKTDIEQLSKAGPSAELETLKKERDQFEQLVKMAAVENHPKFKAYFEGRANEQYELAKDIVGTDNSEAIVSLLKQPDSAWKRAKMEEAIAELSPLQQAQLAGVMTSLSALGREKQSAVAQSKETYEKMVKDQQEAATKTTAQAKAVIENAFKSALAKIQDPKTGLSVFQPKDGDEAWNKEISDRIEKAQTYLTGNATAEAGMEVLLQGVGYPALLKNYNSAIEENAKLQAQIKELQGAEPTLGTRTAPAVAGGNGDGSPQPVVIKSGSNPHDVAAQWTKRINDDKGW